MLTEVSCAQRELEVSCAHRGQFCPQRSVVLTELEVICAHRGQLCSQRSVVLTELPAMEVVSIFNLNGTAGDQVGVGVSGATAACTTPPSVSVTGSAVTWHEALGGRAL